MSNSPHESHSPVESDPVWDLLDHASSHRADAGFVGRVTRAARGDASPSMPWWSRLLAPVPVTALAAACVALVAGFLALRPAAENDTPAIVSETREQRIAHIQEVLETEMLLVAVENLDDFSNEELFALIGF